MSRIDFRLAQVQKTKIHLRRQQNHHDFAELTLDKMIVFKILVAHAYTIY
jgi:hypothetical protein